MEKTKLEDEMNFKRNLNAIVCEMHLKPVKSETSFSQMQIIKIDLR